MDMEASHRPEDGTHLSMQGPHWVPLPETSADSEPPFVPLRLVLQPSGASIEVSRPDVMIGRHTDADIRLPLPDVSRRHCRLTYREGGWQVVDLHSLNGIHVNGEQVLQAPLHHGDHLRIGGFTFVIEMGQPAIPPSHAVLNTMPGSAESNPRKAC
jgi:pSer/pThr/pTyr-binding forkhead associated (FHA) protein